MSNIYEALLRAEQERAAQDSAPGAPPPSEQNGKTYRRPSTMWSALAAINEHTTQTAHTDQTAQTAQTDPDAASGRVAVLEEPARPSITEKPLAHESSSADYPAPTPIATRSAHPDWLPTYAAAQPGPKPSPTETSHQPVATAPAALDHVPYRSWKPVLSQLPALLEQGAAVEQFRSLRSRLQEFRELNTLKTVMVSSGVPQEGKTFIAANLAISLARHDASRVLLIDGDMRRASLHKMLGCPNDPGLTEFLAGRASLHEVMQRAQLDDPAAPVPSGLQSLTFIGGGGQPELAADLSGNDRFSELIQAASPLFDWIIVDSSPVNLVADGVNLSRACDGVVLVARGGVTKLEVAQRALSELKAAKMLGVVLNAVVDPPVADGYYGYDGYVGAGSDQR